MNTRQAVLEYASGDLTASEIAEEVGSNKKAVYAVAYRAGVRLRPESELDYRARAERMKPVEAVEYLCGLLDHMTGDPETVSTTLGNNGPTLSPIEAALITSVRRGNGHTVPYARINSAMEVASGKEMRIAMVQVHLCKVRKKLVGSPYSIATEWGYGLRWVTA